MRGSADWFTYWKKAWNTPTVSWPLSSCQPAKTAMPICPRRLTSRTVGLMAFIIKSAFSVAWASSSVAL